MSHGAESRGRTVFVVRVVNVTIEMAMTAAAEAVHDPVASRDDSVVIQAAAWLSGWFVG